MVAACGLNDDIISSHRFVLRCMSIADAPRPIGRFPSDGEESAPLLPVQASGRLLIRAAVREGASVAELAVHSVVADRLCEDAAPRPDVPPALVNVEERRALTSLSSTRDPNVGRCSDQNLRQRS